MSGFAENLTSYRGKFKKNIVHKNINCVKVYGTKNSKR